MSKLYTFTSENGLILYELEGIKKMERPIYILPLEEYIQTNVYEWYIEQLKWTEDRDIEKEEIIEIRNRVLKKIDEFQSTEALYVKNVLYTKKPLETAEELRKVVSFHHKGRYGGSYHLYYGGIQWVRKGQLLLSKERKIPDIKYRSKRYSYPKTIIKRWKKELRYYYSEWEMDVVLWFLAWFRVNKVQKMPNWVEKEYGERGDYFPYFSKKEIEKILFYDMIQ